MPGLKRVAVVTGGNRGIGFAICRQLARLGYQVVLTSRDPAKGEVAAQSLRDEGLGVIAQQLDVTDDKSIRRLAQHVRNELGHVDALVNNAGIYLENGDSDDQEPLSAFDEPIETIRETMETNLYGPYRLCQEFVPKMREQGYGRVVNVSSGSGQLSDMGGREAGYRMSKTALNAVTRIFAAETQGTGVLVNAMCPGWVRTDMGGPDAPRSPEEGADTAAWLATLPPYGPTGDFFRDRKPIPW